MDMKMVCRRLVLLSLVLLAILLVCPFPLVNTFFDVEKAFVQMEYDLPILCSTKLSDCIEQCPMDFFKVVTYRSLAPWLRFFLLYPFKEVDSEFYTPWMRMMQVERTKILVTEDFPEIFQKEIARIQASNTQ